MKEYLEKESVEKELNMVEKLYRDTYVSEVRAEMVSYCCEVVRHLPSADVVEVRHGRWLDALVIDLPVQMCDQCNTFFPLAYTGGGHHYCPNCGAKMDGGANK